MAGIVRKIEVNGEVYTVKKPVGRIGAIHFSLITKCTPKEYRNVKSLDEIDEDKIAEKVDYDTLMAVFTEWSEKVLPHLLMDGPYKYEEMPGEDQFALFVASLEGMNIGKDFFRIVG